MSVLLFVFSPRKKHVLRIVQCSPRSMEDLTSDETARTESITLSKLAIDANTNNQRTLLAILKH